MTRDRAVAGSERVVILGSSGYLGGALQRQLEQDGMAVEGFGSRDLDLTSAGAVDMLAQRLDPFTTLVFASAITPDRGDTLENFFRNVAMIKHVARAVTQSPPAHLVYFSSDALYAFDVELVSEDTPVRAESLYVLSKQTGEQVMARVARDAGVPLLVLRPTVVFGPGNTHSGYGPNRFIRSILTDGSVQLFGQGEERRDHLFVDDAARLTARLIERGASGVLNLVNGESRSFEEVVNAVRDVTPRFSVVNLARRQPVTHREFDVARLRAAVGGDLTLTPFKEALRRTVEAEQQGKEPGTR